MGGGVCFWRGGGLGVSVPAANSARSPPMPPSPGNAHTPATDIGEIRPAADLPRDRLRLLLREVAPLDDAREPWRALYPLHEVLLLVTCATIASCDDFDDIVAWGTHHLAVLRRFSPFHHGIPGARWLRALVNRVDPLLFGRCFESWIAALWPNRHDLIAIDGKTARRTHDRRSGLKALHTLSAYATNARLTLAQLSVPEKTNEITAIPDLLDLLAEAGQLKGALVTIDAMGCQVEIADRIVAHKADYVLTLKETQPSLEAEVAAYFRTAPAEEIVTTTTVEKGHGRIEIRTYAASSCIDWIHPERSYPGRRALRASRPWCKCTGAPSMPIAARSTRTITSPPLPSTSRVWLRPCAVTGGWRACTGCWTWRSGMTCRATAAGTGPRTWPPCAALRSGWCGPIRPRAA